MKDQETRGQELEQTNQYKTVDKHLSIRFALIITFGVKCQIWCQQSYDDTISNHVIRRLKELKILEISQHVDVNTGENYL